jgi:hypothetical protein
MRTLCTSNSAHRRRITSTPALDQQALLRKSTIYTRYI